MNNLAKEEKGTEIIRELIKEALAEKACDIHLEPQKDGSFIVKYRLEEGLKEIKLLASGITEKVIFQLKKMAGMNDETTTAQKGNFFMKTEDKGIELSVRVGTLPLPSGERIVLSVNKLTCDRTYRDRDFNIPDFQKEDLESMKEIFDKTSGIVFITGTAGSGHRETCYSALNYILSKKNINIISLESSPECLINGIVQLHMDLSKENEYYETLKTVIWQDPDVIFIDNVSDRNTGRIISDIAFTGHMVIIRMNSHDIFHGIKTLKKMGFDPCILASTLEGAIAQRRVKTICKNCMEEYSPQEDIAEKYYLRLYQRCLQSRISSGEESVTSKKVLLYRGKGCKECNHTGYRGQAGLYEILKPDMEMKDLFARKLNFKEFKEGLMGKNFVTLREKALFYALSGVTTLEEAVKVSYSS